ncbi:MAG: H4MPT-linked C1 transfer pathway protein [Methanoregula sp.]|nr:H4MPT-linked C1 transfer pathway protein [Methanoregula sp.]
MIGIDVGGANLKVVDDGGSHIHYCPLWEGAPVTEILKRFRKGTADPAAVVMSGELADCFRNKREGISFIVDAVKRAFPRAIFYGTDGGFHTGPVPELAAANWLASADYFRTRYPDALLLDVGSTTADIIPLNHFDDLRGHTDLTRLQSGYLLYTGMLRTNVATLLRSVELDGVKTPVSTEYFATSADAHLVLGHIAPPQYSCDTPDKKEKTIEASLHRLARVVCSDLEEIGKRGALQIASAFWAEQRRRILTGTAMVATESGACRVIVAGIGAPLFARELGGIDLSEEMGEIADALPAFAVREVALRGCY